MSITVQQATIDDLERLYQIERECFTIEAFSKRHIAYLLENPNVISLVAQIDSETAGFAIGLIYNRRKTITGHVYTIDVALKYRRRGVGLRLLKELERTFLEKGVKISYLEARTDNVAARELYRRQGYREVEKLESYYRGVKGVRLKKMLEKYQ